MRRRPRLRTDSGISAATGNAAAMGKAASAFNKKRRLLFMYGFKIGTDSPHGFLAQGMFERRHVNTAVTHRTLADALQEDLVAVIAQRQIAQIGSDAARDGFQPMATGAVLVVGGAADADCRLVL